MEGVKLTVNKGLSNHFQHWDLVPAPSVGKRICPGSSQSSLFSQVNHTVALSTIGESNYHFGVTYVGTKQLSPTEQTSPEPLLSASPHAEQCWGSDHNTPVTRQP
ncbi:Mitochondrial import receptor subunit TOM40 [Saguinus oedipus]|uniref:Mitochondrial import receptor subunit TOM40 n=1 Tax=Saguinus oedipus TaxID=9490 RepID=A0ABQ9TV24_SAGOE|nr:Mitochondrial import receptor subunit TOM40 [Saguinus oedipus]